MPFITTPLLKQQNETAEKVYPQELTLSIQPILSSPSHCPCDDNCFQGHYFYNQGGIFPQLAVTIVRLAYD
jgi:hypothetical protein